MYGILNYGSMVDDRVRVQAYAQALRQSIRPDTVVLDLGTGTGIFALLACRFGARRVFAIEADPVIQTAREIAAANGLGDRIEFIQQLSTQATLPELAGVIISDLRGILPLYGRHLPTVVDARKRFLAPGGVLIPRLDTLWAAVAEAPETYFRRMRPWDENSFELDLGAARRLAVNNWWKPREGEVRLLTEPFCWGTLDYAIIESPHIAAAIATTATGAGTAHGLVLWFDTVLADGVGFSNRPGASAPTIYSSGFFPLEQPVPLEAGDQVHLSLRADLVGEDYVWSWNTTITDGGSAGRVKAKFAQSTFNGEFRSPDTLRRGAANFVPRLDEDGEIERFVLSRMDGKTSLEEISSALAEKYPGRFPSWQDALSRVAELSRRYSR